MGKRRAVGSIARRKYKSAWAKERRDEMRAREYSYLEIRRSLKIEHVCSSCGKVSMKLYCSNECRRENEKSFKSSTTLSIRVGRVQKLDKLPRESKPVPEIFFDSYDCAMCRNCSEFCMMHERMAADGRMPHHRGVYKAVRKVSKYY